MFVLGEKVSHSLVSKMPEIEVDVRFKVNLSVVRGRIIATVGNGEIININRVEDRANERVQPVVDQDVQRPPQGVAGQNGDACRCDCGNPCRCECHNQPNLNRQ